MFEVILEQIATKAANGAVNLLGRRIDQINRDQIRRNEVNKLNSSLLLKELKRDRDKESAAGELYYEKDSALSGFKNHIKFIEQWSDEISFRELARSKKLATSYVDLDTYLIPKSLHLDQVEKQNKYELISELLKADANCIVLGAPGAGKTTSMKKLCSGYLAGFEGESFRIPILIPFRTMGNLGSKTPIVDSLASIIGYKLSVDMVTRDEKAELSINIAAEILNTLEVTLFLDGFDEIPNRNVRENVLSELQQFSQLLNQSRFIITCRSGEFPYKIESSQTYEIAPLDELQIIEFSKKWLKEDAESFLIQVRNSPYYDTAIRPLTLAHLCAIYDRVGKVPDRPKTIYRKIVHMLLEDWDEERRIIRETAYTKFEIDRKFELLCSLAYHFTTRGLLGEFSESELKEVYDVVAPSFELPSSKFGHNPIITELESHTGLFVQCGYESYEFAHRSLQEYLTAEYIVKLPSLNLISGSFTNLPSELAVATSISSSPNLFLNEIVFSQLPKERRTANGFYGPFIDRLTIERAWFVPNAEVVIAITILLENQTEHGNSQDKFVNLVINLFSTRALEEALMYYKKPVYEPLKANFIFHRHSKHPVYALPSTIELDESYKTLAERFNQHADSAVRK